MMSERQELEQLRRLAELERKARGPVTVAPEPVFDPTAGMSTGDKILANIGAGMADLGTGVKSLYTDMFGSEAEKRAMEQEVARKREIDKRLAGSVTGGGLLQVAGGIVPTLAIPGIPVAAGAGRLATAAAGAATGAGYGAIVPRGEGENRTNNMILGGAIGGALPLSMSALNAATMPFRGQSRAAQEVTEAIAPRGATSPERRAVLEQAMRQVRQQAPQASQAPGGSIPLSVPARLGNPELARLEAGSRARSGANWYDFDQNQARAVADEVMAATRGADDLAARRALRSNNRSVLYNQAMGSINEPAFARDLTSFRANLDQAARSAEASNPAVRNMVQQLADEIDRLGADFTPEHLATIRANLASKAPLVPTNAYQAAPRESPATMSVLREVDNILNGATGGRWQDVVGSYARDSNQVRASQAAGKVREAFIDPATGRVRGVSADAAGDVPKITEARLGRALDAARGPRKDLVLDPTANMRLESVLEALRRQNIVQGVKRSATAGGGSNTASDQFAAGTARALGDVALDAVGGPGAVVGRSIMGTVRGAVDARKDRALAEALQNEQAFIRMLENQAAKEGSTLDRSEVARLLRYLRGNQ
jgi:hypothetical protein